MCYNQGIKQDVTAAMAQWSKAGCQTVQVRPLCKIYCVFVGTNDLSKEGMWCLNWWCWIHFLIQIHQVLPKVCVTTHVCVLICHFIFCDNLHTSGMSWIWKRFCEDLSSSINWLSTKWTLSGQSSPWLWHYVTQLLAINFQRSKLHLFQTVNHIP